MSRKLWIIVISAGTLTLLLVLAGVAALVGVPWYRSQRSITKARDFAAAGNLYDARLNYQEYLYQNDGDIQALEEYIAVCERIVDDRRRSLLAAGRAYIKLAQKEPENPARRDTALEFYRKHQYWQEFESTLILFHGADPAALSHGLAYDRAVAVQEQGRVAPAIEELEAYLGLKGIRKDAPLRDAPLRLARLYRDSGRERDAQAFFEDLLKRHTDDAALRVQYAEYLLDASNGDAAAEQLQQAGSTLQDEPAFLLASGRLASLREDFATSLQFAARAMEKDPESVDTQLAYVLALERNGQRVEAIAHLEGLDPLYRIDRPGFLMLLVEMKLENKDLEGAESIREAYVRAYPDQKHLDAYLRGRIAFARGREDQKNFEEARDRFIMAVEMSPNFDRARYYLAVTELELKNEKGARNALEVYLKNNPGDEQARRLWTRYFEEARSLLELRYAGQNLLEETSPSLDDLLYTAQDLLQRGTDEDRPLAQQLFEKAVATAPSETRGYSALAAFYLDRNDIDKAEKVLADADAAGLDPTAFALLNSSILLARGDAAAAVETAQEYIDGASPDDVHTFATFFARRNHLTEGDALLRSLLATQEGAAAAQTHLFRVSLAIRYGTMDDARARLKEAEEALAGSPEQQDVLNQIRLTAASSLIARRPVARDEIDALLQAVETSNPKDDGLILARTRLSLTDSLPDYERADTQLATIPEDAPVYDQALLLRAEIAYRRGLFELVAELANKALALSARNTSALYLLGEAQLGLRQINESRASMEQILEIDSSDTRAMRMLVRIYTDLQLPQRAEAMLARYTDSAALDPEGNSVEELQAYLARSAGELAASETKLTSQLESDPDNFAALTGLVRALVAQGRTAEGITKVKAYLERNPNAAEPWVYLGRLILEQGPEANLDEASTAFTRAQIIVPEHGPAQLGLVDVQMRQNNIELAVSMCRRYLKNRPNDTEVLHRLATLLSKDPATQAEALQAIDRAMALGERPEFIRLRAFLYTRLGEHAKCVADLERLKTLTDSTTADDDLTLAEAYHGLADPEKAQSYLASALTKVAGDDARLKARADGVAALLGGGEAKQ